MSLEPDIYHGTLPLQVGPTVIKRANGTTLDSATLQILTAFGDMPPGYVEDQPVGLGVGMWCDEIESVQEGETGELHTIQLRGLMSAKLPRRRLTYGGREVSVGPLEKIILAVSKQEDGEDPVNPASRVLVKRRVPKVDEDGEVEYKTIVTPSGVADRWNINEAIVELEDVYFSTTAPAEAGGVAATPPNAPVVPSYIWGGYNEPLRFNHPNGWVLYRDFEEIYKYGGSGLWRVTDRYEYYQIAQPD